MSSEITTPETSTVTVNAGLVPASFRFFGDITQASSKDSGILAMATHLDRSANVIHVGISLTPPGVRYDKIFSRSVALYRLRVHMAETSAEIESASDELKVMLASVRGRVKKTSETTKLTEEQYLAARALHPNASTTEPANVGYRVTKNTYFEVDDFTNSIEEFTFTVPVPEDATHLVVDKEILEFMLTEKVYPKWLQKTVIVPELQNINEYMESLDDELTVDDINESFDDLKLVENDNYGFFVVLNAECSASDSISPIHSTREELAEWYRDLADWIMTEPALQSSTESTMVGDFGEDSDNDTDTDEDEDADGEDEEDGDGDGNPDDNEEEDAIDSDDEE